MTFQPPTPPGPVGPASGAATLPPPHPGGPAGPAAPSTPPPAPGRGAGRTLLLIVLGFVSALMILQGALVLVGLWFRTSSRTPLAVDAAGIATVRIDVDAGTVRVEPGDGIVGERRDRYGLVKPSTEVRREGDTLVVSGRCRQAWLAGSWCATDVTLTVPPTVRVVVRSGAGDVRLGATEGGADVQTGAGDVTFAGTAGTLLASSGAGDVDGDALEAGRVDVESGAGDVRIAFASVPADVRARSGAGDVVVEVPDGETVYRVDAESGAGTRDVDVRTSPTATVTIVVRSGAGDVDVRYLSAR